jgi:hypothetical protein
VLNRRFLQGVSVAVIGLALACAPMAVASAHKAKHHKPKHHTSKTISKSKGGSNPTSSICVAVNSAQASSGNLGSALEKVFTTAATGDFATAKQEMIAAMNSALKEEGPTESALRSAPANVQTAMKGLFTFETNLKTASVTQLRIITYHPRPKPGAENRQPDRGELRHVPLRYDDDDNGRPSVTVHHITSHPTSGLVLRNRLALNKPRRRDRRGEC